MQVIVNTDRQQYYYHYCMPPTALSTYLRRDGWGAGCQSAKVRSQSRTIELLALCFVLALGASSLLQGCGRISSCCQYFFLVWEACGDKVSLKPQVDRTNPLFVTCTASGTGFTCLWYWLDTETFSNGIFKTQVLANRFTTQSFFYLCLTLVTWPQKLYIFSTNHLQ